MKALAVLLLAVLGCSLQAQGRIVAKCDLRNQLKVAVDSMKWPENGTSQSSDQIVAQLVCLAEKGANFDTSALKELPAGELDNEHTGEGQPHSWENSQNRTLRTPQPWVLNGIFQLSNGLSCNDSVNATHNICGLACSKLLDDDISDDISCLLMFFQNLANNGCTPPSPPDMNRRVRLLFRKQCTDVKPSDYFADCPPPPN